MFFEEDAEASESEEEWGQSIKHDSHVQPETNYVIPVKHERVIVHIDIDCFYAQVEMIHDPSLRDKPLGIQQKNIIVTCNYLARERGLTKLMFLKDAKEKCKDLVIVNGEDLTKYREMSDKIFNLLQKFSPLVEKLGMDENYIDVTAMLEMSPWKEMINESPCGHVYGGKSPIPCPCGCAPRLTVGSHIAAEVRASLHEELGITCCGGVSHNKLLAKLVGSTHKPNQQTVLYAGAERQLMTGLGSVKKVPGIGHMTAKRLASAGIMSVSDLADCPLEQLRQHFEGPAAQHLKRLAEGHDDTLVTPTGKPQSMSDEDSFKKCNSVPDAKKRIGQLSTSLLNRLLPDGRLPQTLRLTIRKFDPSRKYFGRESRQRPIPPATFHQFSEDNLKRVSSRVVDLCLDLFTKMIDTSRPFHLTLINVCVTKFTEGAEKFGIGAFLKPKSEGEEDTGNERKTPSKSPASKSLTSPASKMGIDAFFKRTPVKKESKSEDCEQNKKGIKMDVDMNRNAKDVSSQELDVHQNNGEQSFVTAKSKRRLSVEYGIEDRDKKCSSFDEPQRKQSKRTRSEEEVTGADLLPSNKRQDVDSRLPSGIDPQTFQELPLDIQQELMGGAINSEIDKRTERSELRSACLTIENESQKQSSCVSISSCSSLDAKDVSHVRPSTNSSHSSHSGHSSSHSSLPDGIDQEVFSQLPAEVQRSVLAEHHAQNVQQEFAQMKSLKSPLAKNSKPDLRKSFVAKAQTNTPPVKKSKQDRRRSSGTKAQTNTISSFFTKK